MPRRYSDGSKNYEEYISNLHKWQQEQLEAKLKVNVVVTQEACKDDKDKE